MTDALGPVTRKVVSAFDLAYPEVSHPEDVIFEAIINDLPGDHARLLPRALAEAVPVVAALLPEDRLLLAIRLLLGLDVVEAVGSLLFTAESRLSADAAIGAAALASNPSVAAGIVERVNGLRDIIPMSDRQRAIFDAMAGTVRPDATQGRAPAAVYENRWPGVAGSNPEGPLVIVEHTDATPAAGMWLLLGELYAAGVLARRVFDNPERGLPKGFLHPDHVAIGWTPQSILGLDLKHYVRMPAELFHPDLLQETLESIATYLASTQGVELDLSRSPRFCKAPADEGVESVTTTAGLTIQRQIRLIRQSAYEAVLAYIASEAHFGSIQYAFLMQVGEDSTSDATREFAAVIAQGFATHSDNQLAQAASDGVNAAVSELIRQKRLRYEKSSGHAVLQRIP